MLYSIYKGPNNELAIIPSKFNWMAFFFTWMWAFAKRLWGLGILILLITFMTMSLTGNLELYFEKGVVSQVDMYAAYMACSIIFLCLSILCGSIGNIMVEKKLKSKGYKFEKTIFATDRKTALMLYSNPQMANQ